MVIWRERPFANGELYSDLTLGTAGGADESESADSVRVIEIGLVLEWDPEGSDEGFCGVGGFGVEDLEGEEGVVEGGGEGEGEALVPDGAGGARVVGLGGETAVGVEPEDGVGLEFTEVAPVDILEVLGGDDRQVEVEGLRRRRKARGRHGRRRWIR